MADRGGKKRIVIVIRQFFPRAAGAETQALRQARSYIEMGHEARVVTAQYDPALPHAETIEGVPVTRLPAPRARFFGSIIFLAHLAGHLAAHRTEYDAIITFHIKQASAIAALAGRCLRKRIVISVQAAGAQGDVRWLERMPLGGLILRICRKASAFISGASEITAELSEAGFEPRRIHFIPNGIPIDKFQVPCNRMALRRKLGLPEDAFIAVNVGRHTAQKDLKTVLAGWRAFAPSHHHAILVLVGDGDERADLESFVSENELGLSVRFEGWRSNVAEYLAAADVFVSSSLFEGTHIALGEAMAAGLPVIATPVGGARDFVDDGGNGFLIPTGGAETIAQKLTFLAADRSRSRNMGAAARETAKRELAQDETAEKHIAALSQPEHTRHRRRLRVTHLIATLDTGGSERQMAELAALTDKSRFRVNVIALTRGGPTGEILAENRIPFEVIGKAGKLDFASLFKLVRLLLSRPPDILHTWLFTSNLYGRIAAALAGVRRVVVSERSTDPWKSRAHRAVDRMLSLATERIVANSRAVRCSLTANGIPATLLRVIPNGVDCERFRPRDARDARFALGLPVEGRLFGFVGRLAHEKAPENFITAARDVLRRVDDARAVLFGGGPLESALKSRSVDMGGRVIFYGHCERPELAHAALDCLVLTSRWEGFPNAVLEAMACGRPVAALRMPATAELIEPGETGFLVDGGPAAIADAVTEILENQPLARRMGSNARRAVEKHYSMGKMAAAWESVYLKSGTETEAGRP